MTAETENQVETQAAPDDTYDLRVINYSSVSPTYTLKASLFDTVVKRTAGKREVYVMTCEKNGKVLQRDTVFIGRGQAKTLDLRECRRKW